MSLDDPDLLRLAELAEAGLAATSLVHEVRQPLFALRTMAQLGQRDREGFRMDELLAVVDHLESLLAAWSDVGRREEARVHDVREIVAGVVRMMEGRRRQVGARLLVEPGEPVWADGPPSVARQVALNLVVNALDAVSGCETRVVSVRIDVRDGRAALTVEDSGAGVPTEVAGTLFQPFVTSKPAGQGTGLGLYVARRLCVEQGGGLEYEALDPGTRMVAQFSVGPMKKA